jgi:hypothetical protein
MAGRDIRDRLGRSLKDLVAFLKKKSILPDGRREM